MFPVIRSLEEATPEKLTDLLDDFLVGRVIKEVKLRRNDAFNSAVAHLDVVYNGGVYSNEKKPSPLPTKLLLKLNGEGAGLEEVAFYRMVLDEQVDDAALVPCFSAAFDTETGASHLLLLDVSATHRAPVERSALLGLRGVPSAPHLRGITETLAHFHAAWWGHPLLDGRPATWLTERYRNKAAHTAWWDKHRRDYETFTKAYGQTLSDEVRGIYETALEHYPKLWRYLEPRSRTRSGLTLTHNDCYLTQFLCPKAEYEPAPTYLVDFQDVCTDFAARDLVYLMATFWTREQRQRHERGVLEHYHSLLVGAGVKDYTLAALHQDYRLMLIDMIFHPIWDTTYGADSDYWRPKLECLTAAYQDWSCDELFI